MHVLVETLLALRNEIYPPFCPEEREYVGVEWGSGYT